MLATETWPANVTGYTLVTAYDSYTEEFPIVTRTDTTLTVTETLGHLPDGVYAWEIWGKRRNERILLDGYSISYEIFGNTLQGYRNTGSGHNA